VTLVEGHQLVAEERRLYKIRRTGMNLKYIQKLCEMANRLDTIGRHAMSDLIDSIIKIASMTVAEARGHMGYSLSEVIDKEELYKRRRKLAFENHPDLEMDPRLKGEKEERMKNINASYDVLKERPHPNPFAGHSPYTRPRQRSYQEKQRDRIVVTLEEAIQEAGRQTGLKWVFTTGIRHGGYSYNTSEAQVIYGIPESGTGMTALALVYHHKKNGQYDMRHLDKYAVMYQAIHKKLTGADIREVFKSAPHDYSTSHNVYLYDSPTTDLATAVKANATKGMRLIDALYAVGVGEKRKNKLKTIVSISRSSAGSGWGRSYSLNINDEEIGLGNDEHMSNIFMVLNSKIKGNKDFFTITRIPSSLSASILKMIYNKIGHKLNEEELEKIADAYIEKGGDPEKVGRENAANVKEDDQSISLYIFRSLGRDVSVYNATHQKTTKIPSGELKEELIKYYDQHKTDRDVAKIKDRNLLIKTLEYLVQNGG